MELFFDRNIPDKKAYLVLPQRSSIIKQAPRTIRPRGLIGLIEIAKRKIRNIGAVPWPMTKYIPVKKELHRTGLPMKIPLFIELLPPFSVNRCKRNGEDTILDGLVKS